MIGYPSGQDGAILPAWDYPLPVRSASKVESPDEECNRLLAFLVFSVGKCFLKCSENSQHLLKEKERDMKSSRGSVNFVLSYKFNECDFFF